MVNSYIALDIETTGLSVKEDRIIEIGAAKIIDGQLKESYITLVDPKMVLPERIIELTGIRNDILQISSKPMIITQHYPYNYPVFLEMNF